MDRTKFFKKITVNDIEEVDWLYNRLSAFEMKHEKSYYMTDDDDIGRPDLISYENYKTVQYWWLICLVNNIENPLTDITAGMRLIIPNVLDINAFQRKYKIR